MALDIQSCLSAGECIVITNNQYYMFISLFILVGILFLIILMVAFFTPAMIFLKAKFKKASLIYSVNRGQMGKFLIATEKSQGIADVQKVGPFIVTENSHTIESKSKLPFYFAFGEFASTLPLSYAALIQNLREKGTKITDIDDLAKLGGMEFNEETKGWVSTETTKVKKTSEEADLITENIKPYKTISLHNLASMFPFNITPALIESKVQHMIGLKQQMFNKMTPQFVMMFVMIVMGVTLASVIAFKFLQTGDTAGATETTRIIERVVMATPVANMTG